MPKGSAVQVVDFLPDAPEAFDNVLELPTIKNLNEVSHFDMVRFLTSTTTPPTQPDQTQESAKSRSHF
jgi:hypothetical protein